MLERFSRKILWTAAAVFLAGVVPAWCGAVASKTNTSVLAAKERSPAPIIAPKDAAAVPKTRPLLPDNDRLPQGGGRLSSGMSSLTKEDQDQQSNFMREMNKKKDYSDRFFNQRSKLNGLHGGEDMGTNTSLQGKTFEPQNSESMRFFDRETKLDKKSAFGDKESSLGGKTFETKAFRFKNQPGLPEFDLPPASFFEDKASPLGSRQSSYAAKKARGFDQVSRPKAYTGPEALRARQDMRRVNQAFFEGAQQGEDGSISFDRLPDRPLNIAEVKSLLNEGHR
ncbi:MAG: hypothetical protein AAGK14_00790 [Verrucomicrobiota bacterium]